MAGVVLFAASYIALFWFLYRASSVIWDGTFRLLMPYVRHFHKPTYILFMVCMASVLAVSFNTKVYDFYLWGMRHVVD